MFLPFAVPWMPFYVQCDIVALVQGSPPKPRDHIFFERSQAEGSVELLKSRAVRGSLRICLRHGYLPRFFFFFVPHAAMFPTASSFRSLLGSIGNFNDL